MVKSQADSKFTIIELPDAPNHEKDSLKKHLLTEGVGDATAEPGQELTLNYRCTYQDGTLIDSSYDRGRPLTVVLGDGKLIQGLEYGLQTMKRGEKALFKIRPCLNYTNKEKTVDLPENRTLLFEIELIDWKPVDLSPEYDGSVIKTQLQKGEDAFVTPKAGQQITVQLVGRYVVKANDSVQTADQAAAKEPNGEAVNEGATGEATNQATDQTKEPTNQAADPVTDPANQPANDTPEELVEFDSRTVTFTLYENGRENDVCPAIELCILSMKRNERASVRVKRGKYAFEQTPERFRDLLPADYAAIVYEVDLISFELEKDVWEMDLEERFEEAQKSKQKGTEFYNQCKFDAAARHYQRIVNYIGPDERHDFKEKNEQKNALLKVAYLNLAQANLSMNKGLEAIHAAEMAIKLDPNSVKGYYRKAMGHFKVNDFDKAIEDFDRVLKMEPNNAAAKKQKLLCSQELKKVVQKEKKIFQGGFGFKFSFVFSFANKFYLKLTKLIHFSIHRRHVRTNGPRAGQVGEVLHKRRLGHLLGDGQRR